MGNEEGTWWILDLWFLIRGGERHQVLLDSDEISVPTVGKKGEKTDSLAVLERG